MQNDNLDGLLDKWETNARQWLSNAGIINTNQQIRDDNLPTDLPLAAAVTLFSATLTGQSPQTVKTYRVGCRRFLWFIYTTERGTPDTQPVTQLSPLILEHFYLWLVENYGRRNRATIASYIAASRSLFSYLARRHLTPQNCQYQEMVAGLGKLHGRATPKTPRIKTRQVAEVAKLAAQNLVTNPAENAPANQPIAQIQSKDEVVKRSFKASKPEEIRRQQLETLRDRAIILTLYTSGMRRSEVASLNCDDVEGLITEYRELCKVNPPNNGDGTNEKIYELIITGKGDKERVVYLDNVTLAAIQEYLDERGKDGYKPLFLQHHRGRDKVKPQASGENYRVGLNTVWQAVVNYARHLGVEIKPHDFRHNLATTLLNAGAQLSEVQDILGHASPTTTKQIYAHYEKSHLRQSFARFRTGADKL